MTITLNDEWTTVVQQKMETGRYGSPEQIVGEAMRAWVECDSEAKAREEALRREVALLLEDVETNRMTPRDFPEINRTVESGIASLNRGEGIPGEQVWEELEQRAANRRRHAV